MIFDIRTFLFETPFICALFAILLFAFAVKAKRFDGFWTAGLSVLSLGVGAVLMMLRGEIENFYSIILANLFIMAFYIYLLVSVFRFIRSEIPHEFKIVALVFCLMSFGFYYFTFIEFDTSSRIIFIESLLAITYTYLAYHLSRAARRSASPIILSVLAFVFLLRGLYAAFRAAWTAGEPQIVALMDAGVVHGLTVVMAQLLVVIVSFAMAYMAVDNLQAELRKSASVDPLTQALNRRAFEAAAEQEDARRRRSNSPYAVLICDIDHFKRFNDTHGHAAGDAALRAFSDRLRGALRKQDVLARYGGEEFVAVLPDTDGAAARAAAEKLRETVAAQPVAIDAETEAPITASFGVAEVAGDSDWRERLKAADAALYEAKRDGRNRVAVAA